MLKSLERFTAIQRAMTAAGLAPLLLVGCAVTGTPRLVPPSSQGAQVVRVPVPPPAPPPAPVPAPPPPQAPDALVANIAYLARSFDGIVGIGVTSVDEGWTVAANGDRPMPQQSVSKLWVTMTALEMRDQGRLTLDDPLVIRKEDLTLFHQPIATLVDDDGYETTVGELLRRAMTQSDNTANDRMLNYVGGPAAVNAFIARKGLGSIKFGPGERLLQSGTAGLEWRQEYSLGRAFYQARAALPRSVRQTAFDSYVASPPDGASASAIAQALAKLKRGELLSPQSTAWLITTMESSRTGRNRLRGAVPPGWRFGHKTGTGQDWGSRTAGYNDVGILTAPDGRSYGVAVLIGDTPRPIPERQELMHGVITAIVANHGR